MAAKLPPLFIERMRLLLEDEFDAFITACGDERVYGLRVNTLKLSVPEFRRISPFALQPVPWCPEGFYYRGEDRPGKHPYYYAGLFYIQEPSAMSAVQLLDVRPGERVLDLCAAPGGKSTQIAALLQGEGLLVSNDHSADRVKALVKNIELFGVKNAAVVNESPERLSKAFAGYFDKILIDAPCSGEGMFRKDEAMAGVWSPDSVQACASMQRAILDAAAGMLAPGGRIVYSTCTFAPEENEEQIAAFLDRHPQFACLPVPPSRGFAGGRPAWIDRVEPLRQNRQSRESAQSAISESAKAATAGTARLWPHLLRGEGHFAAVLELKGAARPDGDAGDKRATGSISKQRAGRREAELCGEFLAELGCGLPRGVLVAFGDYMYAASADLPDLSGLKVARPGFFIGQVRKNRFVPSQALAMALKREHVARSLSFAAQSDEIVRYLKGETLEIPESRLEKAAGAPSKGYCLVCADGFSLGWGKWIDGMLKNEYPPGWRWIW